MYTMKKFILPALVLLLASQVQAQTKRIAHRSHSGSNASFTLNGSDNFGNPPIEWENRRVPVADTAKAGANGVKTNEEKKTEPIGRIKKMKRGPKKKLEDTSVPK